MQPYTPHGDSNLKVHTLVKKLSDATLFLLRFADFCGAPTGACKNRSAAPAVASLFRPLDALAAAAPHGDNKKRPLGLCRLRGCFWVWGQGVSYRRKRVKANTLRLRVVPSGWGCSTLCRREQAASTGTPWTSSSRVTR